MSCVDPYELTRSQRDELKKNKQKLLTKQFVFETINKEIEEIRKSPSPTWGYSMWDVVSILEQLKDEIGDSCEESSEESR